MSLNEILAKSNPKETLEEHTRNVIKIWLLLREIYKQEITYDKFWQLSFLSVAYHDFGKICDRFQEVISGKRSTRDGERVRHEFFSGMFLFLNDIPFYQAHLESLIAVFSHHKAFNQEGFVQKIKQNPILQFRLEEELVYEFIDAINQIAIENQLRPLLINPKTIKLINIPYDQLLKCFTQNIYNKLKSDNQNIEIRKDYIWYKGLLNIADWTASGQFLVLENGIEYSQGYLSKRIILKLKAGGKTEIAQNFSFRRFQSESLVSNNVIAIAPTGSGKTEAALLWASSKKDWERIIYLLPTRVTSNAIYTRLSDYFGEEKVQLIHSSARQYIKEQVDDNYSRKQYFRDKSFFKNINVCTVDQLLTLGFNLGYWEVKTLHLLNARVIIDEIHLYNPYTLGLITSTIKYLQDNFNTKFYIMTATMPEKLQRLLKKVLTNPILIKDQDLLDKSRNQFEVRVNNLESYLGEIRKSIKKGKKVLVVVNTVDKAIELYNILKSKVFELGHPAICYHSRFINIDRFKKEREIFAMDAANDGGVLIATQVIEVSLDIDFDILYTENAPIDSIIQRAGRVNRKRNKSNSKVVIFPHYEISKDIYDEEKVLQRTFEEFKKRNKQFLTEKELNRLVNIVYEYLDIESNESYIDGFYKHEDMQYKLDFIKDLTSDAKVFTREGLDSVSVIPSKFEEVLSSCKDRDTLTNHEVSIRRWRYDKGYKTKNPLGFKFFECNYDSDKGLTFKRKENEVTSF